MVEGGVIKVDKTEFTECFRTIGKTPYIMRLAFSAGIGGLLFGYDTGVISGALLYIKEDFKEVQEKTWLQVKGTWRWMLGVAVVPAAIQVVLMLTLPESPRWLYRQNKTAEAEEILARIYPADQVKEEMAALKLSIENEIADRKTVGKGNAFFRAKMAWSNIVVRRGLFAGISVLVAQQFVGINTVMYYSPTIVQLAGFASNITALALSLVTLGLNAVDSIVSMMFVDRYGRRKLMLLSMMAIICCLVVLSSLFLAAANAAPKISHLESTHFGANATCPAYVSTQSIGSWSCVTYLKSVKGCAFCADGSSQYNPGACVVATNDMKKTCKGEHRQYFTEGCPSKFGFLAVVFLGLYIITYSLGMGIVPWILNLEIYPLRYRGICSGIRAVTLWCANLMVSETFLTLTDALGIAGTFFLYAGFSFVGLIVIFLLVPETKGLPIEETERMLEKGFRPSICCGNNKEENEREENGQD